MPTTYPGALRGSAGTLSASEANAVDKSLLVRDRLRSNDANALVRFAQCTLGDADSNTLVAAVLAKPKVRTAQMPLAEDGQDALNTLAGAGRDKIALQTLAPADVALVANLGTTDEGKARVTEQLRAGRSVIAPAATPANAPYTWWTFDPTDGSMRDQGTDGRHPEAGEDTFLNRMAARLGRVWRKACNGVCGGHRCCSLRQAAT